MAPATMEGVDNPDLSIRGQVLPPAPPPPAVRPLEDAFGEPSGATRAGRSVRKRISGVLAAIVALAAKFWAVVKGAVLLLPKIKVLSTAGTALVSVAAYSLFFGWPFAVGFVALLFVHEMGHVIQLRREGLKASAPMFIWN